MTIAQKVARIAQQVETSQRSDEFIAIAMFLMEYGGDPSKAAFELGTNRSLQRRLGPKLTDIIKAAPLVGGLSQERMQKASVNASSLGGSVFADYSAIAQGFVNSLVNAGAYDAMLSSMVPVPLETGTVGAVNVGASAYSLSEGAMKPMSKLSISGQQQNLSKGHAVIVVTNELVKSTAPLAVQLIGRELRKAVALVTDLQFISAITNGVSVATSAGQTAEGVRADIAAMLRSITTGQDSKLFLIVPALVCKMWAMLTDGKGIAAFPDLTPQGGSIQGITVLVSDGSLIGTIVLVDASGIAAASGDIMLQQLKEGSVTASDAPD